MFNRGAASATTMQYAKVFWPASESEKMAGNLEIQKWGQLAAAAALSEVPNSVALRAPIGDR